MNEDYGKFILIGIQTEFMTKLSRTNCQSFDFSFSSKWIPPRFFNDVFYCHNGKYFGNKIVKFDKIRKTWKSGNDDSTHEYFEYKTINLPKQFVTEMFGVFSSEYPNKSTITTNKNNYEVDVCNCEIIYSSRYGKFSFKSDLTRRIDRNSRWVIHKMTSDPLN